MRRWPAPISPARLRRVVPLCRVVPPRSGNATGHHPKPDWRDAYLPGRDVDAVMGIDIETTGIDPARDYIIDVASSS